MPKNGESHPQGRRKSGAAWPLLSIFPLVLLLAGYQAVIPSPMGSDTTQGGFPAATLVPLVTPTQQPAAEPVLPATLRSPAVAPTVPAALAALPGCPPSQPLPVSGRARYILTDGKTAIERDAFQPQAKLSWHVEGFEAIGAMASTIAGVIERNTVKYPGLRNDF
ncbi:MAG: hypothetical protein AAB289_12695, partial [Chloroflexota bacterium]